MRPLNAVAAVLCLIAIPAGAQETPRLPRLTVVLVIDQLRADYLHRFEPYFGAGGFHRLMAEGARLTQTRYSHGVTFTCAGHATVLTGAAPAAHGIIANEWWNAHEQRKEYCARDDEAPLIGIAREGRSPRNLGGSTVGDVLKLSNGGRSRVVAVSGKDRSAIMLGGHSADAVYWMEDTLFVTSAYYRPDLPEWVRKFNASGAITSYFGRTWDRLLADSAYAGQTVDDAPWERDKRGMGRAFPHVLGATEARPGPGFAEALQYSPFQNELVIDFAMAAVRQEGLGQDDVPDILSIGLSANDYVGHAFGPDSHEVLDVTVRTDRLLARFLDFLDAQVGIEHVLLVLTADHGVAPVPEYVQAKFPGLGGLRLRGETIAAAAEAALVQRFGAPHERRWVEYQDGPYLYLDEAVLADARVSVEEAESIAAAALLDVEGIGSVLTRRELIRLQSEGSQEPMALSFHPERSGHVMYFTDPYVIEEVEPDGTTHGSPWSYDRSVPILFFGAGIRSGTHHGPADAMDIAPTLSALLRIDRPPAAGGRVLTEVLRAGATPSTNRGR